MINTYEQASEIRLEPFSSLLVEMLPKPALYKPEFWRPKPELKPKPQSCSWNFSYEVYKEKLLVLERAEKSPYG